MNKYEYIMWLPIFIIILLWIISIIIIDEIMGIIWLIIVVSGTIGFWQWLKYWDKKSNKFKGERK